MRRFAKVLVADQEVTCMLGYKEIKDIPVAAYDSVEQPIKCPDCERFSPSRRGVIVHGRREHGITAAAASLVANTRCQFCLKNIRNKKRIIHHLHWGALSCRLNFRSGNMLQPDPDEVEAVKDREALERACDSRRGRGHTVGFPATS